MRAADEIIDIGPYAGTNGGEIIFQGSNEQLDKSKESLTAKYLTKAEKIEIPENRRKWKNWFGNSRSYYKHSLERSSKNRR